MVHVNCKSILCLNAVALPNGGGLQNAMMMGADSYETEDEISRLMSEGKVPIGVGENTKIR